MEESSHVSAGSCLGKVFLLLMNWKSREEQLASHSLTLGLPSGSVGQICPFLAQFPHSSWALLPAWEGRAKPLYTHCILRAASATSVTPHLAQDPTAGSPSPASLW